MKQTQTALQIRLTGLVFRTLESLIPALGLGGAVEAIENALARIGLEDSNPCFTPVLDEQRLARAAREMLKINQAL